ncbi:MAG: ABC transporter ATP-binding protein [Planctomycetia bacterium]|nr:ABC transporter ATP-binding protein [Planctomycetia bacterium]
MIETRDLTKMYGELYALNRLNLKLEKGDVYGFIGPNGAGKTTTMRILATLLTPTFGEANVCGYSIYKNAQDIRRSIGYMPDFFGVYDDMKVIEYLEFFAAAYRIKGPARRKKCEQVLELVDLTYKKEALVTSLSRGMTQRLGLARVLLHEPLVLLLDEPASGLDPRARIEFRGLLKELRNMGKTIMISSHILPELRDICNKIGIIERGQLLYDGSVNDALRRVNPQRVYLVRVSEKPLDALKRLEGHPSISKLEERKLVIPEEGIDTVQVAVTLGEGITDSSFIPEVLLPAGFKLQALVEEEINIETAFMRLTKGITN